MFGNIYSGKRVFVTGHTGFKGSWLTAWLLSLGSEVCGFSLGVPTMPAHFSVLGLERRIAHRLGDVRDSQALEKAVREFSPQVIFHMAAQSLVRPSYENPVATFATNAVGTLHLLEAVRKTPGIEAVICITSDKCYRNDEWVWGYRETDRLGGDDPYSASKACAEIIAQSYFASFFTEGPRMATVRAGNVIGGGDWAEDRIVPDCAKAWAAKRPARIRSPWATRPWQHVLEPLSGYLWLGARLLAPLPSEEALPLDKESFNFGPAADVNNTVAELADALGGYWPGFTAEMDRNAAAGKKECTLLKLCCDKALAHLHWKATMDFARTVRFTAEWYRAFYEASDPRILMPEVTGGQIAEYAALAKAKGLVWA